MALKCVIGSINGGESLSSKDDSDLQSRMLAKFHLDASDMCQYGSGTGEPFMGPIPEVWIKRFEDS